MRVHWPAALLCALGLLAAPSAEALPRFAARNGMECIQCHVNPTGGGMRNEYGRNVFENVFLPWGSRGEPKSSIATPFPEDPQASAEAGKKTSGFSPDLTEWLALGADARVAYLYLRPDEPPAGGGPLEITSSFFLMQADLYTSARLNDFLTLYLDVGVYSGFEAWGLFKLTGADSPVDLYLKAGRFLPPFGIREVEHLLYTREGVGFGQTDRDTGLELTAYFGPVSASLAVLNGTLGDASFDTTGSVRRSFEKALSTRAAVRGELLGFRGQLGGSFYFSENANAPNPLLETSVRAANSTTELQMGVNDLRAGGFLSLNRGRFTWLLDAVGVRNTFNSAVVPAAAGYATYQELSFVPTRGLEFVLTHEYLEPNLDIAGNAEQRVGLVAELFPLPFTEVRAMVRRTFGATAATSQWDAVFFLHLFM